MSRKKKIGLVLFVVAAAVVVPLTLLGRGSGLSPDVKAACKNLGTFVTTVNNLADQKTKSGAFTISLYQGGDRDYGPTFYTVDTTLFDVFISSVNKHVWFDEEIHSLQIGNYRDSPKEPQSALCSVTAELEQRFQPQELQGEPVDEIDMLLDVIDDATGAYESLRPGNYLADVKFRVARRDTQSPFVIVVEMPLEMFLADDDGVIDVVKQKFRIESYSLARGAAKLANELSVALYEGEGPLSSS